MANGNHALQLVESTSPPVVVDKPASEVELGETVAFATAAVCFAALEFPNISLEAKAAVAARTAAIAMMQLAHEFGDDDFTRKARAAAMPILRRALGPEYFRRWSQQQGDQSLDIWIDGTLELVDRIVTSERKFVAAMAD